nr:hypothetical protein Q903MT_gene4439 [Picea sitchensis]
MKRATWNLGTTTRPPILLDGRKDGLALVGGHITLLSPPYFWSAYLINEGDAFAWVAHQSLDRVETAGRIDSQQPELLRFIGGP